MTRLTIAAGIATASALLTLSAARVDAQGAPPPPPRVAPATASTQTTPTVPGPALKLPAPATPPAPPKVVVPPSAQPPSDSAVALCNNGTWVMIPGTAADCGSRGGLRVAMVPHAKPPVKRTVAVAPNVSAAVVQQPRPAGSTMRCKDGTYLSGTPSADRCSANGGTAVIFGSQQATPTAPVQKRP
jgi:hypothetical protein